jgi:hypothetical protein
MRQPFFILFARTHALDLFLIILLLNINHHNTLFIWIKGIFRFPDMGNARKEQEERSFASLCCVAGPLFNSKAVRSLLRFLFVRPGGSPCLWYAAPVFGFFALGEGGD